MVRFPSLFRRLAALGFRLLSPRSRLRRALLRRAPVSGWASFDRRDYELNLIFFAPDAEFEFDPGMQTLGLGDSYQGHSACIVVLLFESSGLPRRSSRAARDGTRRRCAE